MTNKLLSAHESRGSNFHGETRVDVISVGIADKDKSYEIFLTDTKDPGLSAADLKGSTMWHAEQDLYPEDVALHLLVLMNQGYTIIGSIERHH
jgi:hypothetical protein